MANSNSNRLGWLSLKNRAAQLQLTAAPTIYTYRDHPCLTYTCQEYQHGRLFFFVHHPSQKLLKLKFDFSDYYLWKYSLCLFVGSALDYFISRITMKNGLGIYYNNLGAFRDGCLNLNPPTSALNLRLGHWLSLPSWFFLEPEGTIPG